MSDSVRDSIASAPNRRKSQPSAVAKQAEIEAAIARVQQSIGPDVVRIRYEIGEGWRDHRAISFS
jgi:hypothetical protein